MHGEKIRKRMKQSIRIHTILDIRRCTTFHTYAVVTPAGEWHAVGEMGWFGFSSESPAVRRKWEQEYRKRFLEPAQENDWYMVIVDCHI